MATKTKDKTKKTKLIFCCNCNKEVKAKLTLGAEVYPHRKDLSDLPFWKCQTCANHVGCHHKTADRIRPLGVIPSPAIKNSRKHIHALLDPIWKSGAIKRSKLYALISKELGWTYHTAELRSIDEARKVYVVIRRIGQALERQ